VRRTGGGHAGGMDASRSLTHDEAMIRADLLDVERYDIAIDLTGLFEGDESTNMFPIVGPGPEFLPRVEAAVESDDVSPIVTQMVRQAADQLSRMLAARGPCTGENRGPRA
jgi:hypothetical protein